MTYPRMALRSLATIRHERFRLLRALSTSTLLFLPAMVFALTDQPAGWIFPFTLTTAYSMMIVLLAGRLQWVSLAGLPAMQWLGQASQGQDGLMLAALVCMLLLMATAARRGLHKGLQFWVFCLLLSNMMPASSLPLGQHLLLAGSGAVYGLLLGRWGLRGWARVLPGAARADARRYAWHLTLWGCLAWLAAAHLHLPHTWWLPVLVVGIIDPSPRRMIWLVKERVYGTLIGGLLAAGLAWWQPVPAIHMLVLCLTLTAALMLMQRSFRWFIAGLTLLVLSVMPVTQIQHGVVERVADTLLVGVLLASLAWWLELGVKQLHAQDKAG
ncbi:MULTISPECIES: FUSC family protein [Aquitalea]|uniref:Fusaric acid resistance family protein n=1 Tax=Aquitalea magnusonii TaxID=332411 RepID=A0A318JD75_9NEIS|nr:MULTISPECIES: FUSC family protein [Aquitalea]PXX46348.1 fusaric acid resistance family protein [Aquitalea magnusonii]